MAKQDYNATLNRRLEQSMRLPEGQTCGDCRFYSYCKQLFDCGEKNTECDWAPSRFQLSQFTQPVSVQHKE